MLSVFSLNFSFTSFLVVVIKFTDHSRGVFCSYYLCKPSREFYEHWKIGSTKYGKNCLLNVALNDFFMYVGRKQQILKYFYENIVYFNPTIGIQWTVKTYMYASITQYSSYRNFHVYKAYFFLFLLNPLVKFWINAIWHLYFLLWRLRLFRSRSRWSVAWYKLAVNQFHHFFASHIIVGGHNRCRKLPSVILHFSNAIVQD